MSFRGLRAPREEVAPSPAGAQGWGGVDGAVESRDEPAKEGKPSPAMEEFSFVLKLNQIII